MMNMMNYEEISIKFSENAFSRFYFREDKCLYSINKVKKGIKYLNCIQKDCNCKTKIKGILMSRSNPGINHNHNCHQFVAEFQIMYAKLKKDVDETTTSVRDLHKLAIREMSSEAAGLMTWSNVKCTLNRIRRLKMPPCHNIDDLNELLNRDGPVFENYGKIRGKHFFNGCLEGQFFFSHPDLISALQDGFELFIDATFGVVPYHQEQLLVVMATLMGKPRPIIYIIMSHKTEEIYTKVFQFIRDGILPSNNCFHTPRKVTMDFEMGLRNAAKNVWPEISVFGCNFHYCQALRRNAKSYDYLFKKIENCRKHKEVLKMLMRASLLPIEMVYDGIDAIKKLIENDKDLKENFNSFMEYFNRTWLQRYTPDDWCVFGQRYRTNNHIEGYNCKIKNWIPLNPTPFDFLESLLDLAYDADAEYQNAKEKRIVYKDESRLTPHLNILLPQLLDGTIDELEFMSQMACV